MNIDYCQERDECNCICHVEGGACTPHISISKETLDYIASVMIDPTPAEPGQSISESSPAISAMTQRHLKQNHCRFTQELGLKPCPFCGGKHLSGASGSSSGWIICECGASGPEAPTEEDVITVWNTRT